MSTNFSPAAEFLRRATAARTDRANNSAYDWPWSKCEVYGRAVQSACHDARRVAVGERPYGVQAVHRKLYSC